MIRNNYLKLLYFVLIAFIFINVQPVIYAFDCSNYAEQVDNPYDDESILYMLCPLQSAINIGLYFVGAVLVVLVLYGGIKAILATGDPQQLEGARFGAAIILASILVIRVLLGLLGSDINPLNITSNTGLVQDLSEFFQTLDPHPGNP